MKIDPNKIKIAGYISIGIILFAVLIFFISKYIIQSRVNTAQIPNDDPANPLTDAEKETTRRISAALYDDLKGLSWNFLWRKADNLKEYLQQSDRVFVAVYNYFNMYYGKGQTLKNWLKDDLFYSGGSAGQAYINILERMEKLNLA